MGAQIRKRFARAAEYFGSAAESLQSLELPEDCLIHAVVGVHHASIFGYHAALPGVQSGAALLLVSRELSIVDAALPVLLRRRAACALPCVGWTAEEHAFAFAFGEFELKVFWPGQVERRTVVERATYMLYETYLNAATRLISTDSFLAAEGVGAHSPPERLRTRYDFIASALDLLLECGYFGDSGFITQNWSRGSESLLVQAMHEDHQRLHSLWPLTENLLDAWQRVLSSGVVEERGLRVQYAQIHREHENSLEALAAELRTCALAGCAAREVHVSQFKNCGACMTNAYCCREHQVADWPSHKAACKAARKAAAAASTPAASTSDA
jgi:hypothetical protein